MEAGMLTLTHVGANMIKHGLKLAKVTPFVSLASSALVLIVDIVSTFRQERNGEFNKSTRNKILGLKFFKFLTNSAVLALVSMVLVSLTGGAVLGVAGVGVLTAAAIDCAIEHKIIKKFGKEKTSYKKKAKSKTDICFKDIY